MSTVEGPIKKPPEGGFFILQTKITWQQMRQQQERQQQVPQQQVRQEQQQQVPQQQERVQP